MKKVLCVILSILFVFTTSGCNNPENEEDYTIIVYVSKYGKIHAYPDCSGMLSYSEMPLEKAIKTGFDLCKKCSDDIYDSLIYYYNYYDY